MFKGISISEYRSIGELQRIGPLGKINLFVGPNNSGKSNILRFVNENLRQLVTATADSRPQPLPPQPHLRRGAPTKAALCISAPLKAMQDVLKAAPQTQQLVASIHPKVAPNDLVWIDDDWPSKDFIDTAVHWTDHNEWYRLWRQATGQNGGSILQHWIPETLRRIRQLTPPAPSVFEIPIDRQAGHEPGAEAKTGAAQVLGGKGVIRALAAMQNPQHASFEKDRKRFEAIQEFVRTVTDDPSANLSVTHKQDEILVQMKGQPYLPLASLGSGIEQVVLHAVAASSATDAVVTFEEPELHLHPVLQRQLMTYLAKTSNQYFISTHSAHLIDALHADTFHVRLVDGETVVEKAITDAQRHQVCNDLGYRPSDIVQANCVLWVEGPSDRVYVRHWLKQVDAHLSEHVHFSIMFYGGKLLSHLSAGETDTVEDGLNDLIQLRLLNRQVVVIIDSDLEEAGGTIRDTKARVADEITKHGGLAWISAGREIENYVPPDTLSAAVEQVASGRGKAVKTGRFEKALPSVKPNSKNTVDKVATAHKVEELGCGLQMLDLSERVQQLAALTPPRCVGGERDALWSRPVGVSPSAIVCHSETSWTSSEASSSSARAPFPRTSPVASDVDILPVSA